ncbi:MAG: hypothetical protein LBI14_05995 [Treponema sp.]|jgi:hypothetical protein|nr:hypothetical protein [Treponema sp.]
MKKNLTQSRIEPTVRGAKGIRDQGTGNKEQLAVHDLTDRLGNKKLLFQKKNVKG